MLALDESSALRAPRRARSWAAQVGFAGGGTAALGGLLLLLTGNALLGLFEGIGGGGAAGSYLLAWGLIVAGALLAVAGFGLLGVALWTKQGRVER
jgi:hypothetical protein